jgi:hypothetical protein
MSDLDPFCQRGVRLSITPPHRSRLTGSLWVLLLLGMGLVASARPAHADAPSFADRLKFGSGSDPVRAIAFGDMNGDGSLDLVVGNDGTQSVVYLNDGRGSYDDGSLGSCATLPATVRCFGDVDDQTIGVAVADLNRDGFLDIVAGLRKDQSRVYLNDGRGNFASSQPFGPADGITLSLALGDVNGDAAPDIAAGDETHGVVYLNDGKGGFYSGPVDGCAAPGTAFRCFGANRTDAVALADVNGDGKLDVVAGSNLSAEAGTQSAVYLNDAPGVLHGQIERLCAAGKCEHHAVLRKQRRRSLDRAGSGRGSGRGWPARCCGCLSRRRERGVSELSARRILGVK